MPEPRRAATFGAIFNSSILRAQAWIHGRALGQGERDTY